MEYKDLHEELSRLIGDANVKPALNLLLEHLSNKEKHKAVTILKQRYSKVMIENIVAVRKRSKIGVELQRINKSLLDLVYDLDEVDIDAKKVYRNLKIKDPILVFTEEESKDSLRAFFLQLNFVNVLVKGFLEEVESDHDYNIVIFDNQDLEDCPTKGSFDKLIGLPKKKMETRILNMELIIKDSNRFVIHLGNRLHWINDNRNKVQAANSMFSLHARTKEVIAFVNTYFN